MQFGLAPDFHAIQFVYCEREGKGKGKGRKCYCCVDLIVIFSSEDLLVKNIYHDV